MQNFESVGAFRRPANVARADAAASEFMWVTYRWMSLGLATTGLTAWAVANSETALQMIFGNRILFYALLLAPLGMVFFFNRVALRASTSTTAAMFVAYSALMGLTLSFIFVMYTRSSIASTFFISAGAFAGLSIFGSTTKRDLSAMGRFMVMGLIGLIIASVVNIFLQSPAVYWVSSMAGVLIFSGLTAWDTQRLRQMYLQHGTGGNLALRGALSLYLDFVNLFLFLLRFMGDRR